MGSDTDYEAIKRKILGAVYRKYYRPLTRKNLFRQLSLSHRFYPVYSSLLDDLVSSGMMEAKEDRYLPRPAHVGTIRTHPKGFAFVQIDPPSPYKEGIFIPSSEVGSAVDGDRVTVEVDPLAKRGAEGKVISIIQRKRSQIRGTIHHFDKQGVAQVYSPLLGRLRLISVEASSRSYQVGDRVLLTIENWGEKSAPPRGLIIRSFGSIQDPLIDIESTIEEFELPSLFPPSASKESSEMVPPSASKESSEMDHASLHSRDDYSGWTSMTIDPQTAKDFDDALSIRKEASGIYHLGVHIADVAHYIREGSSLDSAAFERGVSTYFPGYCLPMIPSLLSDDLCSLKPNLIRLTISILIDFDPDGTMIGYSIKRSYIKSVQRFSYEEAKAVLDGTIASPYLQPLQWMVELSLLLKNKRNARGSIDFAIPELALLIDEQGMPYGTKLIEYDITHQLVEEFMLKANELVAKNLIDQGKAAVFRIHESPSLENFEEFYNMARFFGFALPQRPEKEDVLSLFEKAKEGPYLQQLAVRFIRCLKNAYYSSDNVGHYGLALDHYCHCTSPIRRYTDLIIQRILFNEQKSIEHLQQIATHCSERERIAFKAESHLKTLKKLRLLKRWVDENPLMSLSVIISKIERSGALFYIQELALDGFFSLRLLSSQLSRRYLVGEKVEVRPSKIDLILLEVKWELVLPKRKKL